jgi:hypothetical protein
LIKQTAEQLNLPEELVRDVVIDFYKDIRGVMTDFEDYAVWLPGLGRFKIIPWKVKRREQDLKRILEYYDPYKSKKSQSIKKEIRKKLDKLAYMNTICEGERLKKQKIIQQRREMERQHNDDLEKQDENYRGYPEFFISEPENTFSSEEEIGDLSEE